jgi:hypothetical protein
VRKPRRSTTAALFEEILKGVAMTNLSFASTTSLESAEDAGDQSLKTIVLLSCFGVVASLCLMIMGADLSVGWI